MIKNHEFRLGIARKQDEMGHYPGENMRTK